MSISMRALGDSYVASNAVVTGDIVMAAGVNLWFGVVIRGDLARITLGPRVNLQDGCVVHTDHNAPLTLEEGVVAGHAAILHGRRVGRDTLIGMRATVLSGVEIGAESLIAAGALITENKVIPPRSVVMGVPAKVVRTITAEEIEQTRRIAEHYLDMARRYARGDFPLLQSFPAVP